MPFSSSRKAVRFAFGEGGSVKTRVLRSGMWVGLSETMLALLGVVRSVVLARLLSAEIFGLMALASIALRTFETFTRPGLAQALIAGKRDFAEAAPTAFTMLVVRGFVLAVLMVAVAPWIAEFYDDPRLEPMLMALGTVFIVGSLVNINTIAQQKNLDFRRLTYLTQATSVAGLFITIALAYWLRSVWALVIGQIAVTCINAALSYRFVPGRPEFRFDRKIASDLFRYGKFVTGSSIVLYVATELDSAVIGKLLGMEQLGYYAVALIIANLVTTNLSKVVSSIMMPAYSQLQSNVTALRAAYLRTLGLLLLAVMPATAGLILLAHPFIGIVYGDTWLPAAVPLQILAVFGLFRAMAAFSGYLFEGMGVPKVAFQLGVLRLLVMAPIIVPMIRLFGLAGAALAVTAGTAVQWLGGLMFLRRLVGIGLGQLTAVIWRPLWTTLAMVCAVFVCTLLVDPGTVPGLVLAIGTGVVVYVMLNMQVLRSLRRERFS